MSYLNNHKLSDFKVGDYVSLINLDAPIGKFEAFFRGCVIHLPSTIGEIKDIQNPLDISALFLFRNKHLSYWFPHENLRFATLEEITIYKLDHL